MELGELSEPLRVVNLRFRLCTSLVPRPMVVVVGLGTRLHVRMRTTLENGILRNGQQPQSRAQRRSDIACSHTYVRDRILELAKDSLLVAVL